MKKPFFFLLLMAVVVAMSSCHGKPINPPDNPDDPNPEDSVIVVDRPLISTDPAVLDSGYMGKITVYFNPLKGNGGMADAEKCFAHAGLLTSASKNSSDWKHVVSDWRGANSPELTKDGDYWKLEIPSVAAFYGCPETTDVRALCFVFHDGPGGSKEGKTAGGGDIYVYFGEENAQSGGLWDGFVPEAAEEAVRPDGVYNGM